MSIAMYRKLVETLQGIIGGPAPSEERKRVLQPLIAVLQQKVDLGQDLTLHFICTHNSRRSHFAQVWAPVAGAYFDIPNVRWYSGGAEHTALFPAVADALCSQGLRALKISGTGRPNYAMTYSDTDVPIIGFSKKYDSPFSPASGF